MLTLYVDRKAISKDIEFINVIDLRFDKEIYNIEVTDEDKRIIKVIDNAEYDGNGYIVTPFGKTEIQNLSTGCKTLILINHSKELGYPVINIGECGKNVLDIIFRMGEIRIYLDYCLIPNKYDSERVIKVVSTNGSKEMKLGDVFNKIWRRR